MNSLDKRIKVGTRVQVESVNGWRTVKAVTMSNLITLESYSGSFQPRHIIKFSNRRHNMAIIKSLAVLKLASTFCNSRDYRAICSVVKINHLEDGFSEVVAANGHTLIKISSKLLSLDDYNFSLIKMDSIAKACKVNEKHLLLHADEIHYPNYNRVLEVPHVYEAESASFNINYMAKIFTALNTFCKDLKIKLKPVTIGPLRKKESSVLLAELRDGEGNDIKIEVAIMPMRKA